MNEDVPFLIRLKGIPIKILKSEGNLAKGEIVKFNFIEGQKNTHKFKDRVTTSSGFDGIWEHISQDWFKLIGKYE
jgi:hypothetical protein